MTYDVNDTVEDSIWKTKPENAAAYLKTKAHTNTPSIIVLDSLGRPTVGIDLLTPLDGQTPPLGTGGYTTSELDIEGNALSVTDARGNVVMSWRYDMLGHRVAQTSMDAGKRWMLNNALGNPVKTWDERNHEFSFEYDALHRPTKKFVKGGDGQTPLNHCYEWVIYGEGELDDKERNLRGQAAILYDTAGKITSENYDFKGNLLRGVRTFAKDYKNTLDWNIDNPDKLLENANYTFTTSSEYDALNRVVKQTTPDGKTTMPSFNTAGLLERITLQEGNKTTEYVKNIDYDAKGQRTKIQYGNGTTTKYEYDPLTFRLNTLRTTSAETPPLGVGGLLQDLAYTYDPTGNITQIEDKAIPVVFFDNKKIMGKNEYTYDALYRLITAEGREQNTNSPNFDSSDNWNDAAYIFSHKSGDVMAMRLYTQRYQYDAVGNILQMKHEAGANGSWTRDYTYETQNNRLKTTTIGSRTYQYPHHAQHGFMSALPHLQSMVWTFKEELQATTKQSVNNGTPKTTYYVYDGTGQRARKITENATNSPSGIGGVKDERIYVGGFEVYRNKNGLERETLHIMDDTQRIAMIETCTKGNDDTDRTSRDNREGVLIRYQYGNHLGSTSLELDDYAVVISYEEYHPYGTTAYQARNAEIKAAAKRYRYTGMERDEETGLAYHSARYYLPWLGRWASPDGYIKSESYNYCNCNPINMLDANGNAPHMSISEYFQKGISYFEGLHELYSLQKQGEMSPENIRHTREFIYKNENRFGDKWAVDMWKTLNKKPWYINQRNSVIIDGTFTLVKTMKGKGPIEPIGDVMCGFTSLSMSLYTLGFDNPSSDYTFPEYFENLRLKHNSDITYSDRTDISTIERLSLEIFPKLKFQEFTLVKNEGTAKNPLIKRLPISEREEIWKNVKYLIEHGAAAIILVKGHWVRLQEINKEYIVVDDPYAKNTLGEGEKRTPKPRNSYAEHSKVGSDSKWTMEEVNRHNVRNITVISIK